MGSGKTVVGGLVAQRSGAAFRDLDLMVEDQAGMAVSDIFAIHSEADANWKLIRELATTVYLEASFETVWGRIGHQANRPLFFGHPRDEIQALMNRRRPRYEEASHRVNADAPLDEVASEVMKLWSA